MPPVIRCFLSRAAGDQLAAEAASDLTARLPGFVEELSGRRLEVFDCANVPWGSNVADAVRQALKRADVVVPLVSRAYVADKACRKHVTKAKAPLVVVPVLSADYLSSDSDDEVVVALAGAPRCEVADVAGLAERIWARTRLTTLVREAVATGRVAALIATIESVAGERGHQARLAPLLRALEQRVERLR